MNLVGPQWTDRTRDRDPQRPKYDMTQVLETRENGISRDNVRPCIYTVGHSDIYNNSTPYDFLI